MYLSFLLGGFPGLPRLIAKTREKHRSFMSQVPAVSRCGSTHRDLGFSFDLAFSKIPGKIKKK